MLRLVCCLAVLALAAAQIPARCASPAQWSAQAFVRDSERGQTELIGTRYFYDAVNQRKARFDQVDADRNTSYFIVIELHQEGTEYIYDIQSRSCKKQDLRRPFIPHSVVDNATYHGDYIIGSSATPDSGVEIEVWTHRFESEHGTFEWTGEFTRSHCFPVESHVEGRGFFFVEQFIDIVVGLPDPNVFIPPEECQ
ncbi:uncharacterized protein MONBRDRAFT_37575 [Monosiga brevicollis MX1]|uniref:Mammalian ependymin-related protein 1 n=1 Tax=Monosiga brevicollis TaxID=81824 RepID=A9V2L7_MONBE|nr:uncharacterized protein MONBRDRAFT_37575 [Monosiga brevicollis MX1]EDQ88280.1 predicted protein [Monosiga brevicollis MX1]|eukprot:XP_001746873.1 hypothetical protein [Monosiga brevicollis MX1]